MRLERATWAVEKSVSQISRCYLVQNSWDDFGFQTLFEAVLFDDAGHRYDLGYVKLLKKGMSIGRVPFDGVVSELGRKYCSLGSSIDYYKRLSECPESTRNDFLLAMRDVVFDPSAYEEFEDEPGFQKSLLRDVSPRDVKESFPRALRGDAEPTAYDFAYSFVNDDQTPGVLQFAVRPHSRPPSNIHVLIGRNGVGKTRLLAGIADSLTANRAASIGLSGRMSFEGDLLSGAVNEFQNLVIVTYSVFDRFDPIKALGERTDTAIPHYYIGVKSATVDGVIEDRSVVRLKSHEEVLSEFEDSISKIIGDPNLRSRLARALQVLESDPMISDMKLRDMLAGGPQQFAREAHRRFATLSSGHKVVMLTIVRMVELVSERSLVLIDEPETHLHPPLLSSFVRALSDLLQSRNGVAVIATHSPVLLQEVPSTCVQVVARVGAATTIRRPETETFGENVGTLTRRVFELEVENSGFYRMLVEAANGRSFEEVINLFDAQIGGEGRAVVRASASRSGREESPSSE